MLICSQLPPFLDRLPYNFRSKNNQKLHQFPARPLFHFLDTKSSARGLGKLLPVAAVTSSGVSKHGGPLGTSPNDSWTFQWEYAGAKWGIFW
jgi:hypothetical protein